MRSFALACVIVLCAAPSFSDPAQLLSRGAGGDAVDGRKSFAPFTLFQTRPRLDFSMSELFRGSDTVKRNAIAPEELAGTATRAPVEERGLFSAAPGEGAGYQPVGRAVTGWDFVVGRENTRVSEESTGQTEFTQPRKRLRAGVKMRRENLSTFYGFNWMGEKLEGEPEDNIAGSLQLQLRF